MDLQKLFNSCEILLMQMKEDGYCEDYIKNVRFEINWIKRNPKLLQCTSYLELYEERLKTGKNPESSQERIYHKRSLFTILQRFEENNEFPNHHKKVPLVQKSAYSKLRGAFKELVDYYKRYAILNDYSVNTITKCVSKASCFLLHLQRSGHDSLETVTESDVISFFTDDNGALCRSRSYRKDVESVLTAAEPLNPLTKKIRLFLPTIKRRRKNIQYFTQEESLRLRDALENGATELTKRDLAIGMLLYFTGLRAGDISDLQLNEIDWQSEIICRKQSKTGVSVELPMSVGVGNALFEYITKERPDKPDPHVFLWNKPPYMPIDASVIWPVTAHIYKAARIRQNAGDQRGSHLFRHHVATHLATQTFHTLWEKANTARCVVPYELRHNYATENINGWTANDSFGLSEHLLYLSKSMGHRNLSSTLYYYSIVPGFADIILEKTEMGFNKIVPEVTYEKE